MLFKTYLCYHLLIIDYLFKQFYIYIYIYIYISIISCAQYYMIQIEFTIIKYKKKHIVKLSNILSNYVLNIMLNYVKTSC